MTDEGASGGAWVGLDVGTQSARAIAATSTGQVLGTGSHTLVSRRDGCRHEQDPEDWWTATAAACRAMMHGHVRHESVRGVAICATSGTILLSDDKGRPLTPGLMYDDARAIHESLRVQEAGESIWEELGYRMQPSWALPKLLCLLDEYSKALPAVRLVHQADFIARRFVGHAVPADSSHALKTGYDLLRDTWPHAVLTALGVPEHVLPPVVRPGTRLGTVAAEAAAETGIPAGTPLIAGMTDACAAQLAAGVLSIGSWNSVVGTTLVLKGVSSQLIRDPYGAIYSHRSPDDRWWPGGASSTGAGVLAEQFRNRDLDELNAHAAEREPSSVIAYPLVSRGERFPFFAPKAEGFVLGESFDDVDRFAALLQGVAYVERLCFDYLDFLGAPITGEVSLTGGATRSPHWCQLRADVLGRPVRLVKNAESAFGMAVLAASTAQGIPEAAARMVHVRERIESRPGRTTIFLEPYLRLVGELERRGWLDPRLAAHACGRAT